MSGRLTLLLPRAGFAALVAACFGVPVVFSRHSAEAFMVPKLTLLWLCVLVALLGVATWTLATRRCPLPRTQIRWPLALLLAWTTLATALGTSPWRSLLGGYGRYDGLLGLVIGVAVLGCTVAYTWRQPQRLRPIALAIVASALVGTGYITLQQVGWDWIDWREASGDPIDHPYGLLGNSNFSGAHLAVALPLLLLVPARRSGRWPDVLRWFAAGWLLTGLWWTETRGGMLAAAGGVAVAGALAPATLPRLLRWGALALTVVGIALVATAGVTGSVAQGADGTPPELLRSTTLLDRRDIWGGGVRMAAAHPLVGVGPDAFWLHFPDHRRPAAIDEVPLDADEAHNVVIDRMATAGLPAAAAWLWLVAVVARASWRRRGTLSTEEDHRSDDGWILAGFGGAFGAYLLQGMVSIDVVPLALLGWVTLGALTVVSDSLVLASRHDLDDRPIPARPVSRAAIVSLLAVTALLASLPVRVQIADWHQRQGLERAASGRPGAEVASAFRAAATWLPIEPRYQARHADVLVGIATREVADDRLADRLLTEALDGYEQALRLAPRDIHIERSRARALVLAAQATAPDRRARLAEAAERYAELVERVPDDIDVAEEHGLALELLARTLDDPRARDVRRAATARFEAVLDARPWSLPALTGLARIAVVEGRLEEARRLLEEARAHHPEVEALQVALDRVEVQLAEG